MLYHNNIIHQWSLNKISTEFLLAFICNRNPIIKGSKSLYQIIGFVIVIFPGMQYTPISINNIATRGKIFGLDNVFNRIKGKDIYVSMDNADLTKIYFDNECHDIRSYVPKIFVHNSASMNKLNFVSDSMNKLDFDSVKYYFNNLISDRFNLVIHYNFKNLAIKCVFEHYDIYNGDDVSDILNNTKHRIECVASNNNLTHITSCFNINYTAPSTNACYTVLDNLALINVDTAQAFPKPMFLPVGCTVVYIHRFYTGKLGSLELVLPPTIKHLVQSGNFSLASDKITLYVSKSTNIIDVLGIDIQEY